jgi:hypothetical protein
MSTTPIPPITPSKKHELQNQKQGHNTAIQLSFSTKQNIAYSKNFGRKLQVKPRAS